MTDLGRETVLGLDNVRLELPIAGVGSRALAAALDYLLLWIVSVVWVILVLSLGSTSDLSGWATLAIVLVGFFLLDWGYFAGLEIAGGGRTLGKRAVGLRVVDRDGGVAGAGALLLRNLLRLPDILIGAWLVSFDPLGRRLGDRVAGTLVIHERRDAGGELILGRVPAGWSAREVEVVEAFLARLPELEPDQKIFLARRLLAWVERDAPEWLAGTEPAGAPLEALETALAARQAEAGR